MNNNRQISIRFKHDQIDYKKNFSEHEACIFVSFFEKLGIWYEISEATGGERPVYFDEIKKDDKNEQQKTL
tara:strand:- start:1225 stop:1437 length:213 start_codon:yes stop_codon:yes gene_type:complete